MRHMGVVFDIRRVQSMCRAIVTGRRRSRWADSFGAAFSKQDGKVHGVDYARLRIHKRGRGDFQTSAHYLSLKRLITDNLVVPANIPMKLRKIR